MKKGRENVAEKNYPIYFYKKQLAVRTLRLPVCFKNFMRTLAMVVKRCIIYEQQQD